MHRKLEGIYGTMYYVNDMSNSVKFFKEMFGPDVECNESPEWTEFVVGDNMLCLHLTGKDDMVKGAGILIFKAHSVSSFVAELKKHNIEILKGITEVCPDGFSADYKDVSGNIFSVFGPK